MFYLWQHLERILLTYRGELPLHYFLKQYFRQYPKLGSRDRRGLSDAVYAWYRCGKAIEQSDKTLEERRLGAMYLCGLRPKAFERAYAQHWEVAEDIDVASRISRLIDEGFTVRLEDIFPGDVPFSEGITKEGWILSLLEQPRLFLRIREDKSGISGILKAAAIPHEWVSDNCLALPNGTKAEELFPHDAYVVQDASSQATGAYLKPRKGEVWWDSCSGAGGKALMLMDEQQDVRLLTTDVRASILENLGDRFRRYHLPMPEMMTLDVSDGAATASALKGRLFDGIICDVPCTGSGTWARTPESCFFFDAASVAAYAARQKAILTTALSYLKDRGRIIYITCSVFRAENEDVINAVSQYGMKVVTSGLIDGSGIGADALFAAELRND
jgi:16S rRNA (cytosine967-C5)-methyltransferase